MAKKTDNQDGANATIPGADSAAPAAVAEEQPTRGGSFIRNEDGSLTQTEGHGFAPELANNQE